MSWDIWIQQIINGVTLGAIYGLIAIGYTMVYGIIGMINFAHGDVYMVSAYLTAIAIALLAMMGIHAVLPVIVLSLIFAMVFTGILGWSIERIAYRPLRRSTRLAPLISAIGVSLILQEGMRLSQGARDQGIRTLFGPSFRFGNETHYFTISQPQILITVVAFLSMAALTLIISRTKLGRMCRATQQDRQMAGILGVDTNRIISSVFVIGAAMAAVAGVLVSVYYGSFNFFVGFIAGVKAFTAAVLGGIGSLPGAMLGGIVLGMSESLFAAFVNSEFKDVFAFGLLVLILIFKPSGLLGRPEVEKV